MPQVMFPGDIHVIDSIYHVKEAVRVLSNSPLVGFDTETKPSFRKGVVHKTAFWHSTLPRPSTRRWGSRYTTTSK